MKRDSYIFYRNWWETFRNLPDETRLEVYDGMMQYAFEKEEEGLSVIAKTIIGMAKPLIDKDRAKYEAICERNKNNGNKGGRPKTPKNPEKPRENPENPVGYLGSFTETQKNPKKPYNDKVINDKVINDINIESKDSLSVVADSEDKISYIEIVTFYNNTVKGKNIPQCIKLTEKRKQAIKARVTEFGKEKVYEAITKAADSSFCNGANKRNWKADFDFIFNSNKMANILEGRYDNEVTTYGNGSNSIEQNARRVGESALRDIFEEMEERRRIEGAAH